MSLETLWSVFQLAYNSVLSINSHTVLPYLSIYLDILFPISSK